MMVAGLILLECIKFMKSLISKFFNFLKKEWFLILMVASISIIILLFELLS